MKSNRAKAKKNISTRKRLAAGVALLAIAGSGSSAFALDHPDALFLSSYHDLWLSEGLDGNAFGAPSRWEASSGLEINAGVAARQVFTADFDGDGLDDIATTIRSRLYVRTNNGENGFGAPVLQSLGWNFRLSMNSNFQLFPGDFNGDGLADVAMTSGCGEIFIGYNSGGVVGPPALAVPSLPYVPTYGIWFGVGDVNGDGLDDMVNVQRGDSGGAVAAAVAGPTGEFITSDWGSPNFTWDLGQHSGILLADFTGDGKADLLNLTQYTDAWVAVSTGSQFDNPTRWATLGFRDAYIESQEPVFAAFAIDFNNDGKVDIVDLTDTGELWGAASTGSSFGAPIKMAVTGFTHNVFYGPAQTYFGHFTGTAATKAAQPDWTQLITRESTRTQILPTPTPSLTPIPATKQ
ncbi:hypothetical protein BH09SUM1_BH09SUM1_00150 [soil metagenome]